MHTYPKAFMSVTELVTMGFSRTQLRELARSRGQKCCYRMSNKPGSKILIDTAKLEKELQKNLSR